MSATCSRPDCNTAADLRGLCPHHYRRLVHYGVYRLVDGAPVVAHLQVLRDLGWTWTQIGKAAAVSPSQPCALAKGKHRRMRRQVADALLSVKAVPARSRRGMDITGARRRLQALQWMGWPMREIAARVGRPTDSIPTQMYRGEMSAALIRDIARVYDELAHLPGPSKGSATKARRAGHAPPAAWDDDSIDDPAALPDLGAPVGKQDGVDVAEVRHLWRGGLAPWEIAKSVGVSEGYVSTLLRREAS